MPTVEETVGESRVDHKADQAEQNGAANFFRVNPASQALQLRFPGEQQGHHDRRRYRREKMARADQHTEHVSDDQGGRGGHFERALRDHAVQIGEHDQDQYRGERDFRKIREMSAAIIPSRETSENVRTPISLLAHSRSKPSSPMASDITSFMAISFGGKWVGMWRRRDRTII